jgi:hypothetical protein
MLKKSVIILTVLVTLLLAGTAVFADEGFYPWQGHAAPFDFLFGNLIDNHQQSKQARKGMLQGFIYIQFTEEEKDGVPVAVRADCENSELDCRVGWKFKAIPISATLVSTKPRVWLVDKDQLPPGSQYLHFHWSDDEDNPQKPCGLQMDKEYDGYLMQRVAVTSFFWLGGNPEKGGGGPGGPGGSGGHDGDGCGGHDGDPGDPHDPGDPGPPGDTGSPGDPGAHEGGYGDHGGRLVTPGMDYHSNIVTDWDPDGDSGPGGPGGPGGHDGGGCGGHDDNGSEPGCDGHSAPTIFRYAGGPLLPVRLFDLIGN